MRTISNELQDLLDLDGCETQTTLDIYLADGVTEYHFAGKDMTLVKDEYSGDLIGADDVEQSIGSATDRVSVSVQNVDKAFGAVVMAEDLVKARAVIGRLHRDPRGILPDEWTELFRGEAVPQPVVESEVRLEIVSDLIAAGFCVANWTLADPCQLVFKDAGTCGYSGGETLCNKIRFSDGGCRGRDNEHRFGGMEYPAEKRTGPTGGSGGTGPGLPSCFSGRTKVYLTLGGQIDLETLYRFRDRYIGGPILSFDDNGNLAGDTLVGVSRARATFGSMLSVRFEGDSITTGVKRQHRFLTESNEFREIEKFQRGDRVMRLLNGRITPVRITHIYPMRSPFEWVYNLTTKTHHHYFADGCAVHNSKSLPPD